MFDYLSGCYFCKICCQNSDLNYIFTFEGGLLVIFSFVYKFDNVSIIFIMNTDNLSDYTCKLINIDRYLLKCYCIATIFFLSAGKTSYRIHSRDVS